MTDAPTTVEETIGRIRVISESGEGRYGRQELVPWWDQEKLSNSRVLVVGAGAIGNEVLKTLALVGVGTILVIDMDTISPSNLSRTVLFREEDVGKPKASTAAARAMEINPEITVRAIDGDLTRDLSLRALSDADVVIAGLDSVEARFHLNRRCYLADVPWLNAGIGMTEAQLTHYRPRVGACYECTYTDQMAARFRARYSCTGLVKRVPDKAVATTAVTATLIGAVAAHEALSMLHKREQQLAPGTRATYLMDAYRSFVDVLPENAECFAHADRQAVSAWAPEAAATTTPERLAAQFGITALKPGFDVVDEFSCETCGATDPVFRPDGTVYEDEAKCPVCGTQRRASVTSTIRPGSAGWSMTLQELGMTDGEVFAVHGPEGERWMGIGGIDPWTGAEYMGPSR